ncbi:MAG: hypothetical protein WCW77_05100 [Patescibacteria group bacterium]|jgi:hypothetical protein
MHIRKSAKNLVNPLSFNSRLFSRIFVLGNFYSKERETVLGKIGKSLQFFGRNLKLLKPKY